jgi:8-oxo-dGTP pyrophosphatase MutT (NUDIX family)
MHRRPDREWYPDVWDIPGGHVERDETEAEALVRELREELGIEIATPSNLPFRIVADEGFELSVWTVTVWTGSPVNRAKDEHDDLRWIALDEIEDLSVAHRSYPELFRAILGRCR